ncbi:MULTISPECIES: glycosyltransferase [Vibrio]|uniref:glycosyltransferase n=1 Tax=Vibrio TaxID=662 RepID=UPI0010BD405A|nr:glycosyltransferase [Vibrio sp. F12]TKE74894.1 glycosyltransferase [Vibrio sp. F12]
MNSKISVLMSVYNEPIDWLELSIESILNQTHKNIEFIIVLDNPDNVAALESLSKYRKFDDRIVVLKNEKNVGLVESLNRALSHASGDFIARMDADDISHKDRFEKQLKYLLDKKLDLVGSNVKLFDDHNPDAKYTTDKLLSHYYIERIMRHGTIGIVHPTFFARAEVFNQLNGYVNSPHTEDKEFIIRALIKGFKLGNLPDTLLECRYSSQSVTKNNAIYVNLMGHYLTRCYREYLRTGHYLFDTDYYKSLNVDTKTLTAFKKKQLALSKSRHCLGKKNYLGVLLYLLLAGAHSKSTLRNIAINIKMKVFRGIEKNTSANPLKIIS